MSRSGRALCGALALVAVACGPKRQKPELVYEEPVTTVWTGRGQQPAQPAAPADAPAPAGAAPVFPERTPAAPTHQPDAYPPTQAYPPAGQNLPPPSQQPSSQPQASPPGWPQQGAPQAYPTPQAGQQPAPGGWRNPPPRQAPKPPATGFPDASVTTTVVPDQDPTTQTTLKRRTGWVRGGFD